MLQGPRELTIQWIFGDRPSGDQTGNLECGAAGRCTVSDFRLGAAPDGSLWVTGLATTDAASGVFLAHHDPDGRILSWDIVETRRPGVVEYRPSLRVDRRGHAFLAVTEMRAVTSAGETAADMAWLEEFDVDGQPVGSRIPLPTPPEGERTLLAVAADTNLAAAQEGSASLSLLSTLGVTQQQLTRAGLAPLRNLVADQSGQLGALAYSFGTSAQAPNGTGEVTIEQYASDGMLLRASAFRLWMFSKLGIDRDGNLIRTGYMGDLDSVDAALLVHKLLPTGDSAWIARMRVPEGLNGTAIARFGAYPEPAVADTEGTIFVPGGVSGATDRFQTHLFEISADGQTCALHRLPVLDPDTWELVEELAVAPDGALYFDALTAYGRFVR